MDDSAIVELFWKRDEQAIAATTEKYNVYCLSIAMNILGNIEDAEECVNDAYLNTWNSIPPNKPKMLSTYLGKIIFLHDVGYGLENIMRNIDMVKNYSRFTEVELGYWSYFGRGYKDKVSPSDLGKECLENILQNEITMIGDEDDEDEL